MAALVFTSPGSALAEGSPTPRELYDQGKFQDALTLLQNGGLTGAEDYYNAGNCFFKLGKPGVALAHYEKAGALAPNHPDIRYNLDLVAGMLEKSGSLPKDRSIWTGQVVPFARRLPDSIVFLALALSSGLVAWFGFRVKRRGRSNREYLSMPFLAALAVWVVVLAASYSFYLANSKELGAVVGESSVMRSGPAQTFTELMQLPPGTKVELLGEPRDGWRQIRFSLGNVGWIMEKDLLTL